MSTFGPVPARCDAVHDGDTIYLTLDVGFGIQVPSHDLDGHPVMSCRVFGINSPELDTPAGKEARDYAEGLLKPGDRCMVVSHGWDKYGGRFDGSIALMDGSDFAARMVDAGHAVRLT